MIDFASLNQLEDRLSLRALVTTQTADDNSERSSPVSEAIVDLVQTTGFNKRRLFRVRLKGQPFRNNGLPPFHWQLIPGDLQRGISPVVRILLARGAWIEDLSARRFLAARLFPGNAASADRRIPLGFEVFRLEREISQVELGQDRTYFQPFMTPISWTALSRSLWDSSDTQVWTPILARNREHQPFVQVLPDGLLIEKRAHRGLPAWKIRVRTPLGEPAAYAYNLLGPTFQSNERDGIPQADRTHLLRYGPVYTVRIVKTANVEIEVEVVRESRETAVDFRVEYHVVNNRYRQSPTDRDLVGVEADPPLLRRRSWNHVGVVPEQGAYLDPRVYQFYTLTHDQVGSRPGPVVRWSSESLTRFRIIGDPIPTVGRRPGTTGGRVAPTISSRYTEEIQLAIAALEVAIGLIPIVGTLYDVASLLYISSAGRSIWGEARSLEWWDLLGAGALGLGILDEATAAGEGFRRAVNLFESATSRSRPIERVMQHIDAPLAQSITPTRPRSSSASSAAQSQARARPRRQIVDTRDIVVQTMSTRGQQVMRQAAQRARALENRTRDHLLRAVQELRDEVLFAELSEVMAGMPRADYERFIQGIAFELGAGNNGREALAGQLFDLGEPWVGDFLRLHERRRLLAVMSPDLRSFQNDLLAQGYASYVATKRAKGLRPRTQLGWLVQQRNGRYADELVRLLGQGFARRIRSAMARGLNAEMTDETVEIFLRLNPQIQSYDELVEARRAASSGSQILGAFFDADHLLEKRFINSLRTRIADFDTGSLEAMLVPKNQGVLDRLRRQAGSQALEIYDHSTKTQLMRAIIPYKEHDFFSLQQWWDAHVWVYQQLETPNVTPILQALRRDFDRLAGELGETYQPRLRVSGDDLMPSTQMGRASSFRNLPDSPSAGTGAAPTEASP